MKLHLLALSTAFLSFAVQAETTSCLGSRANGSNYVELSPTCVSHFEADVFYRATFESVGRVAWSVANVIDKHGYAQVIKTFLEETIGIPEINVDKTLRPLLEGYVTAVEHGLDVGPEQVYQIFEATSRHYLNLNKLLENKNLRPEERQQIQSALAQIKLLSEKALWELNEKATNEIKLQIEELKKEIAGKLRDVDYSKLMAELEEFNTQISRMSDEIEALRKDPVKNADLIAQKEKELKNLTITREQRAATTISDIRNYSQFAQGLTSLYSLFNPKDAARISSAINGITQIATAYVALQGLGPGMLTSAAAFGHYGTMAMGITSLISAFSGNQNDVHSALFKQLRMISKQITQLQERMDSRFDRIDETLFQLERKIMKELGKISTQISRVENLQSYSNYLLEKLQRDVLALSRFTVNREIDRTIRENYLNPVRKCIGTVKPNVKLTPEQLSDCLDDMYVWIDSHVTSNLLTRREFPDQYMTRTNYFYQINELAKDFNPAIRNLPNPFLLMDTIGTLNILSLKYENSPAHREVLNHVVYDMARELQDRLTYFSQDLQTETEYFRELKKRHKDNLEQIHKKVSAIVNNTVKSSVVGYHQSRLEAFRQLINTEIVQRKEPRVISGGTSVYDTIVARDFNKTLNILKKTQENFKNINYEGNFIDLVENDQIQLFIENCQTTNSVNFMLPLPVKYLKDKVGTSLAKRMILAGERTRLCYNLEVQSGVKLLSYKYFPEKRFHPAMTSNEGDVNFSHKYPVPFEMDMNLYYNPGSFTVTYKGLFLKSFTVEGYLDGKRILSEKRVFSDIEKLAWRNKTTDPASLLTLYMNESYIRHYPQERRKNIEGLYQLSDINSNSERLYGPSSTTSSDIANIRQIELSKNQEELYKEDVLHFYGSNVAEVKDAIEKIDMDSVTESGMLINLALYFRDPDAYEQNAELQSDMSEIWGLRSGPFLKKFYKDVYLSSPSQEMLDFVKKDQERILDKVI